MYLKFTPLKQEKWYPSNGHVFDSRLVLRACAVRTSSSVVERSIADFPFLFFANQKAHHQKIICDGSNSATPTAREDYGFAC